jgi:hypothetical protein
VLIKLFLVEHKKEIKQWREANREKRKEYIKNTVKKEKIKEYIEKIKKKLKT